MSKKPFRGVMITNSLKSVICFEKNSLQAIGNHFKSLPRTLIGNIRETYVKGNLPSERQTKKIINRALAQYVHSYRKLEYDNRIAGLQELRHERSCASFRNH